MKSHKFMRMKYVNRMKCLQISLMFIDWRVQVD